MNISLTTKLAVWVLAPLLLLTPTTHAENQNQTQLDTTLTPSLFAPTQAIGDATHITRRHRTDFIIQVEDLDPNFYDVYIDNTLRAQISVTQVSGGSEGILRFSTRPKAGELVLNFDPRSKPIEIRAGTTPLLSSTLSTTPNPEAPKPNVSFNSFRIRTNATALNFPPSRGNLLIKSSKRRARMTFEFSRLPAGPLTITANDIPIATFSPLAGGLAKIRLSTDPSKSEALLDFDPANTTFKVLQGDTVILEFQTPNKPIGAGATPIGQIETLFNNTGAHPGAFGSVELKDRASKLELEVHIGALPPGNYDLFVGGIKTTTIQVSITPNGARGRVSFSTRRTEPTTRPLTFDPRGQTLQITQANNIFLSMTFPN